MKERSTDIILLIATLALSFIGLLMITSSSYVVASELYDDRYYYIKRHMIYLTMAFVAYATALSLKIETLRRLAFPAFVVSLILLTLTLASPLGSQGGGATRWIRLAGFRFQPSEFARLATILYLAHLLSKRGEQVREFRRGMLLPLGIIGGVALLILCEPDFGTAVSVGLTGMVVLYVAGAKLKYLLPCILAAIPFAGYAMVGSGYRRARLMTFLDPWKDPLDSGFQIIQSFIAMRSGGFFGKGIGDGLQKIYFLPEAHTDFVFAILGEELGFVGVCGVILLFLIVVWRGAVIAARCQDRFCSILGAGIAFALGMQAFTNMAVVMGVLPTKGLTLPLLSFGGSSLIASFAAIGLLQNLAKRQKRGEA